MRYEGKLYGKAGRRCIPLLLTSQDVDKLESDRAELLEALELMLSTTSRELFATEALDKASAALKKAKGETP